MMASEIALFSKADSDPVLRAEVRKIIDAIRADNRMIYAQMRAEFDREVLTCLLVKKLLSALRKSGMKVEVG